MNLAPIFALHTGIYPVYVYLFISVLYTCEQLNKKNEITSKSLPGGLKA